MENYCNFKPFDKVLVRYDDQHVWQIDFFSHYVRGVECPYKCLTRDFNQCIPYEGHEHLIDTTSEPSLPKQTEQSQTQTKENKMEEDCDNYGYPVEYFKKNDVVLCRDGEDGVWEINSFVAKGDLRYPFQCEFCGWKYCIPYEGNEHLQGTTDTPERYNPNKNTLFGVKLKLNASMPIATYDAIFVAAPSRNFIHTSKTSKGGMVKLSNAIHTKFV